MVGRLAIGCHPQREGRSGRRSPVGLSPTPWDSPAGAASIVLLSFPLQVVAVVYLASAILFPIMVALDRYFHRSTIATSPGTTFGSRLVPKPGNAALDGHSTKPQESLAMSPISRRRMIRDTGRHKRENALAEVARHHFEVCVPPQVMTELAAGVMCIGASDKLPHLFNTATWLGRTTVFYLIPSWDFRMLCTLSLLCARRATNRDLAPATHPST